MKIALQVNGQDMIFSEEELTAIVEKHFTNGVTERVSTKAMLKVPTEDQRFEIDSQTIDQSLFQKEREASRQERTRLLILEAFEELKDHPEKYARKFYTMMPKKDWDDYQTVAELKKLAGKLGDHNADWVEQALEWAQRICNGESWEAVCNDPDTANWYRLVVWKDGYARLVGGSRFSFNHHPASDVGSNGYCPNDRVDYTVPLVVLYEK